MAFEARSPDWLEELHELNHLFLTYVRALADAGRPCLGLPRPVARRLAAASTSTVGSLAELPTALFHLRVETRAGASERRLPDDPLGQMHVSLALTILSSAWHLARSRPFEARMFLHLSRRDLARLRATPLSALPTLANDPDVLRCAFADGGLTWSALVREEPQNPSRMLILIALQPDLPTVGGIPDPTTRRALHSLA